MEGLTTQNTLGCVGLEGLTEHVGDTESRICALSHEMAKLIRTNENPEMVEAVRTDYKDALRERGRLMREILTQQ